MFQPTQINHKQCNSAYHPILGSVFVGALCIEYKWLCRWTEWQWLILWHQDVHHKSWQNFVSLLNHDCLSTFTTDSSSKLNVLRHDGHTLGMNSTQVGVFKKTHQVGLTCFLRTLPKKLYSTLLSSGILCTVNKNLLECKI